MTIADAAGGHVAHLRAQLAAAVSKTMDKALWDHRVYTETRAEQSIQNGDAVGFIKMDGSGECIATVSFPIKFTQKPVFSAGLELGENISLQTGGFPIWSATVGGWGTDPADGEPIYSSALLGIVVLGSAERTIIHYRFAATSYVNPVNVNNSMNAPL